MRSLRLRLRIMTNAFCIVAGTLAAEEEAKIGVGALTLADCVLHRAIRLRHVLCELLDPVFQRRG